jgi:hypothetical protein
MVARTALKAALILLPLVTAGVSTWWIYRGAAEAYVDFERHYEDAFVSGFHDHETMDGRGFRWTARDGLVRLQNLPRQSRLRVEVRIKGLRPRGNPLPHVRFTANGATVFETICAPGLVTYRFGVTLPGDTLELGIHPEIFVPAHSGREDERVLGIQVFSILVVPRGGEAGTAKPTAWMTIAGAALLASALVAGLSLASSSIAATVFSSGFVLLLSLDSVRFLPYPRNVAVLAVITLTLSVLLRGVLSRLGWPHPSERSVLVALLVGSFLLKTGTVFFPLFVSSDADFHANRLLNVLEGSFFTESVSQHDPPFRIPYPVSLYVLAAPWAMSGLGRVAVIKGLTALFDVGVGLVLFFLARRFLSDARAGILAAVLYQLVPLNFLAFSAGNFTNLFGVAATVFFIGFFLTGSAGGKALSVCGAFVFSFLALTAHFGTFLFGLILWPGLLVAVYWLAAPAISRYGGRLLMGAVLGSVILALVYYAGYGELFTSQWERVLSRDYASGRTAVEGPLAKLAFNLPFYKDQLGVVFAALALVGALPLLRRPEKSPFHAAAVAWMGTAVLFFVLDLTTALEVRYVLQVLPLLALFAGSYLSGALERGRSGKVAAVVIFGYLAVTGLVNIHQCILYRYH